MHAFRIVVATCLLASFAAADEGYYRQPALHGDTVVFVAEGDLWRVSADGGTASRLTTHAGLEGLPVISPDGSTVAFHASYEGPTEVYTMPIDGGRPTRWTYRGENAPRRTRPVAWRDDDTLVYTTRGESTLPEMQLVEIDLPTRVHTTVPLAQAADAVYGDDALFFVRRHFNGSHAKRYTGGTIEHLWRFDGDGNEAVPLTSDYLGTSRTPMWGNGRLYFVSDRDGTMNIWSCDRNGGDLRQHSKEENIDIREASMDGTRIVYRRGADLKLLDLSTGVTRRLEIDLPSDFEHTREQWIDDPMDDITSAAISPNGDRIAVTVRGEVFVFPVKQGRRVDVTRRADVRYRGARFVGDGARLAAMSDESGEVELWTLPADGLGERAQHTDDSTVLPWTFELSPDGTRAAVADKDFKLWVIDTESGARTLVQEGGYWLIEHLAWSPDGRWLAYEWPSTQDFATQVMLHDVETNTTRAVTTLGYNSFDPVFHPGGEWLYFLSDRNFRSVVNDPWGAHQPEPFFDRPTKVYALALRPGARSPFMQKTELDADEPKKDEKPEDGKDDDEPKPVEVVVELDGLAARVHDVPIAAGNTSGLVVTKEHIYWHTSDSHETGRTLRVLKIGNEAPKPVVVTSGIREAWASADGKKLLVSKADALHVIDADGKAKTLDGSSRVDMSGWRFSIDPREAWRQMYVEAWRLMRDYFYDRDMHGVDWPAMLERYRPLVDRVTDRHELNDVIAYLVSELSALHHSVRGGDLRDGEDDVAPASLGARLTRAPDAGGYRIDHIYRSDPDEPERRGPLARLDLDVAVGDVITHVNGVATLDAPHIAALLRNQIGRHVRLRLAGDEPRDVIVFPISANEERALRYHEWEYTRRLYVEEKSGGRIGYIHLQHMGSSAIAAWTRQYARVVNLEGLIVDVRHNTGGNIDSWVLNRLIRPVWMYWAGRAGEPYWNMQMAFRGHRAMLIDQWTMSDGEAVAEGFRRLELGPLIGKRTWGGGIWLTSSNVLADGGLAAAAEFGVYSEEGEWLIEGSGVSPDIEVDNLPHATFGGADAQLDAAIEHLLQRMDEEPVTVPTPPAGKDLSFPK